MSTADKALTVSEMSEQLGICKFTARKLIKNGSVPAWRLGKMWRVSQDVLNEMLRSGGVKSGKKQGEPRLRKAA